MLFAFGDKDLSEHQQELNSSVELFNSEGPEVSIDESDLNFGLVRLGQTVQKQITLNNMASIITPWYIRDSPAFPSKNDEDDRMAFSEFTFEPSEGELKPLESKQITVTFYPLSSKTVRRVIEVIVDDGKDCNIGCFAEVQSVQACLLQCEVAMPEVHVGVPVMATARLFNQTLLPTVFEWGQTLGEDAKDCEITMDPCVGGTCW